MSKIWSLRGSVRLPRSPVPTTYLLTMVTLHHRLHRLCPFRPFRQQPRSGLLVSGSDGPIAQLFSQIRDLVTSLLIYSSLWLLMHLEGIPIAQIRRPHLPLRRRPRSPLGLRRNRVVARDH